METKTGPDVKSITIIGRRWFQKSYGNTYHTCIILVNGQQVHECPKAYGYGDQYAKTAYQWLEKFGYMKRETYPNGGHEAVYQWAARNAVSVTAYAVDVARERPIMKRYTDAQTEIPMFFMTLGQEFPNIAPVFVARLGLELMSLCQATVTNSTRLCNIPGYKEGYCVPRKAYG
jgi:hypothetical protein